MGPPPELSLRIVVYLKTRLLAPEVSEQRTVKDELVQGFPFVGPLRVRL